MLHILPHRGGGAETYLDLLEGLEGYAQARVPLSAARTPAAALPSIARRLPRVARAARGADLPNVHGDTGAILSLPLVAGRRWLWTTHGLHLLRRSQGPRLEVVRSALRGVIRSAALTVCTSAAERDELAELAPARERLRLVHVGLPGRPEPRPGERDRARAELGLEGSGTVALFAGQLEPRKHPLTAVRAVREARQRGADVTLLMAGDGPLRGQVESEAGNGVRALGFRSDLDRLMLAADVFVLPSAREGLAMALLEAMAAGLAPVVAAGPGNPEAVGDTGIVVPPGDVAALAGALAGLAGDPGERERLGAAARARQGEEFGVERFRRDTGRAWRDALAAR